MAKDLASGFKEYADAQDSDVFIYAGPISTGDERVFNQCVVDNKHRKNVTLILSTLGGSADTAYQVVRSIRRNYGEAIFRLCIPSLCKSAGTLIALGANEIVMSDTAELGPLDIQIAKPEELGEFISGLTANQAIDTLRAQGFQTFERFFLDLRQKSGGQISTRMAAEIATKLAVGFFAPVFEQFDPMRLGENSRANLIAVAYGNRICTENVRHETVEKLVTDYPSHTFAIDREEAGTLFENVRGPNLAEKPLLDGIRDECYKRAIEASEVLITCMSQSTESIGNADTESDQNDGEVSEAAVQAHQHPNGAGFKAGNKEGAQDVNV